MSQNLPDSSNSTSLERALDQNEAVQETVEQSAAELCVINVVLKQEVPDHVQTGEVAQALQKTGELESRIQSSAQDLAQVNQVLKDEISARAELERQLASTQAELDQIQAQSENAHSQGGSRGQSASQ
ncbi:MAG: hypothetical protein ABJA84_00380 [Polaromonas sp.]